ncbi:hypothetical protein EDC01DRAFT_623705 [Geopyxis carbonaria]|nr:hypothetical protein EDC01DRAFT_623705 [Geopyxis carbonaria]
MPFFSRRNRMPVAGRLVVITGGSQGMGKAVALLLTRKGASIVIVARDRTKLDAAIQEIQAAAPNSTQRFLAVSADMSIAAEARRAFDEITEWYGGVPDLVWQCAGGTQPGYFRDASPELLEKEIQTNYIQVMHTAHNALRVMSYNPLPAGAPQRHIIFTSSVLALYPIAGYNTYSPGKAAIRSLADGLRQECLLYDIAVHCCFPATIYSPGFENEQKTKPELTKILEGSDDGQTPEKVAEVCVKKLERGQFLVVTTFLGEAMRGATWGGSPRGNFVWDTIFGWIIAVVWGVVGKVLDWEVIKFKRKLEKEGRAA